MADNSLKILIDLVVNGGPQLATANQNLNALNKTATDTKKSVDNLSNGFGKLLTFFVGAAGLKKAIDQFSQLEDATSRLTDSLARAGKTNDAFVASLDDQAAAIGRLTNFTTAQVRNLQALTVNLGLAEDQTLSLNKAIATLAEQSGQDLASVAQGFGQLIRTGNAPRGLLPQGFDTRGFDILSPTLRAQAINAQAPQLPTENSNELKQLLTQINDLFGNIGKTLNTVLGPALRFINGLLSIINNSPILSSIVSGAILGGGLILAINTLIGAITLLISALAASRVATIAQTISQGISASGGLQKAITNALLVNTGRVAVANRAVSGITGTVGGALGLNTSAEFGLTGAASGAVGNGITNTALAALGVNITGIIGIIGRLSVVAGLLYVIFKGFASAFDGLIDVLGPSNVNKIKSYFSDIGASISKGAGEISKAGSAFSDTIASIGGKIVDGTAAYIASVSGQGAPNVLFDKFQAERKAAQEQIDAQKNAKPSSTRSQAQQNAIDLEARLRLNTVVGQEVSAGVVEGQNIGSQAALLAASQFDKDRVQSLQLQAQLLSAQVKNDEERVDLLDRIKTLSSTIVTDLKGQNDLTDFQKSQLQENKDKVQAINDEQKTLILSIGKTKGNIDLNTQAMAQFQQQIAIARKEFQGQLDAQILSQQGFESEAQAIQDRLTLEAKILEAEHMGIALEQQKVQLLQDQIVAKKAIADLNKSIDRANTEDNTALIKAQNLAATKGNFGSAGTVFEAQKKSIQDQIDLNQNGLDLANKNFKAGTGSQDDIDKFANQLAVANQNMIALQHSASDLSDIVGNNLVSAFDKIVDGTASASEALKSILTGILGDITKVIIKAAAMRLATGLFGGATGAGQGFGSLLGLFTSFPTGGIVGANDGPLIAPDGHRLVGVQPGELILNQAQQRTLATGAQSRGVQLVNINTFNDSDLHRAMASSAGQSVTINNIKSNPNAVRSSYR